MEKVLNYKQVMELTGLKKSHIYQLFNVGKLSGYCSGKRKLFFESGVQQYMESNRNVPAATPRPAQPTPPPRRSARLASAPPTGFRFL